MSCFGTERDIPHAVLQQLLLMALCNLLHNQPTSTCGHCKEIVWGSLVLLVMCVADVAQIRCVHYSTSAYTYVYTHIHMKAHVGYI